VTGLTASAGVAPNKFLAKVASGWVKPDGLTVIAPDRVDAFVRDLPVDALWGVGPKTAARLRGHGLHTLADVRARPLEDLQAMVGGLAEWLIALAHGHDDRPVEPNRPTKQTGSERTYAEDLTRMADIRREVDQMARAAAGWLERKRLFARTVVLKVRYHDFTTITRSHSTRTATRDADELAARALALVERTEAGPRPVRLLGVSAHGFADAPQPCAASDPARLPFDPPTPD
jgi:DNA polymerase-4